MEEQSFNKLQIRIQHTWFHEFIPLLEGIPIHGIYTIKIFGAMTPPHYLVEILFNKPVSTEVFEKIRDKILQQLWDRDVIVDDVSHREFVKIGKTIESEGKLDIEKFLENNSGKVVKK